MSLESQGRREQDSQGGQAGDRMSRTKCLPVTVFETAVLEVLKTLCASRCQGDSTVPMTNPGSTRGAWREGKLQDSTLARHAQRAVAFWKSN